MRLADRVKRLERGSGVEGNGCPVCGFRPVGSAPADGDIEHKVVFANEHDGPEQCPECGFQHTLVLTFDDGREVLA